MGQDSRCSSPWLPCSFDDDCVHVLGILRHIFIICSSAPASGGRLMYKWLITSTKPGREAVLTMCSLHNAPRRVVKQSCIQQYVAPAATFHTHV